MTDLRHWVLNSEKQPVRTTLWKWAEFMDESSNVVKQDDIDGINVSTVFLGIDHGFGEGPPILFETMIFGGAHDQYQERCSTWEQAEGMHKKAVALVRGETKE